jgi:hypothetical protein
LNPHDQIADPPPLADLEDEIASDVVALVEHAQRGDPFRIRRDLAGRDWGERRNRGWSGALGLRSLRLVRWPVLPAGGERNDGRESTGQGERPLHRRCDQPSGDQAS